MIGRYYAGYKVVDNRTRFDCLTLSMTRTNTSLDFWDGNRYYDWNPIGGRFHSVDWTGYLHLTESGIYGRSRRSRGGELASIGVTTYCVGIKIGKAEGWFLWK